jgi:serine acetyltransferase
MDFSCSSCAGLLLEPMLEISLGVVIGFMLGVVVGVTIGVEEGVTIGHGSFYLPSNILTLKISYF